LDWPAGSAVSVVGSTVTGVVLRLDRSSEAPTGLAEVILEVNDSVRSLAEGEFFKARLARSSTNAVTTVPRSAVFRAPGGDFVYTVSGDHYVRTAVKLGAGDHPFVEIADGLLAGDVVVSRPVLALWMTELHNVNGGDACCVIRPPKK